MPVSPAAATLSRCVQISHRLDVVFIVDESKSIKRTDPNGLRVDGIDAALGGFARLASSRVGGSAATIKVLFEGFGGYVTPDPSTAAGQSLVNWHTLTPATLNRLLASAGAFRKRNDVEDTDYALALTAARQLLAREAVAQTGSGGAPPCKAVVWFTDGAYLITDRDQSISPPLPLTEPYAPGVRLGRKGSGPVMRAAGRTFLCRPGGLMDGLQSDGVVRFTFGLTREMSPKDSAFLQAVTEGAGLGTTCGSTLSAQTGEYQPVAAADCLFFEFGNLLDGGGCPPPVPLGGQNAFRTIRGLSGFLIRASTGAGNVAIDLTGPTGQHVHLVPNGAAPVQLSSATITPHWSSTRTVELDAVLPLASTAWVGPWSYQFVAPAGQDQQAQPRATVEELGDLTPQLIGVHPAIRGRTTTLSAGLVDPAGRIAASGPLADAATLSADVSDPVSGADTPLPVAPRAPGGTSPLRLTIPDSSTAPYVTLDLTAAFSPADGATIAPVQHSYRIPVLLPTGEGFPTISPTTLHLRPISGQGQSTTTLTFTGTSHVPGCVWIDPAHLVGPGLTRRAMAAFSLAVDSQAHCLTLAQGQSRQVTMTVSVHGAQSGTMNVTLPVHLRSGLVSKSEQTQIGGSLELYPPINVGKRILIIVGLALLLVLIPIALLLIVNRVTGLFTAPQQLRTGSREITVEPHAQVTGRDGEPVRLPPEEVVELLTEGADRRVHTLAIPGGETALLLRTSVARTVRDLISGPLGIADAGGQRLVVGGNGRLRSWAAGTEREVPLSLPGLWLFLPSSPIPVEATEVARRAPIEGQLVILIRNGDPDLEAGQKVADRAVAELARMDRSELEAVDDDFEERPRGPHLRIPRWWRQRAEEKTAPVDQGFMDADETPPPAGDEDRTEASRKTGSDQADEGPGMVF